MQETKFIDGIKTFKPNEKAPDFVKANFIFTEEFISFYEKNKDEEGNLKADLKESKGGNLYLSLNNYKI
jgi:hypothetical protein